MITIERLTTLLNDQFGGLLRDGMHEIGNGQCCAMELLSAAQEIPWTDTPEETKTWDLRPLNDISVDSRVRTQHLLPVLAAYAGCCDWPIARQIAVARRLGLLTVNRIIAEFSGLPDRIRDDLRSARDLVAAREAASSAVMAAREASSQSAAELAEQVASVALQAAVGAECPMAATQSAAGVAADATTLVAGRSAEVARRGQSEAAATEATTKIFVAACQVWLDALQPEEAFA